MMIVVLMTGSHHQKYLTLTHWHWEHLFGAEAFNALIFAFQETKRVVEEMGVDGFRIDAARHLIEVGEQMSNAPKREPG